jgi:hypothetical protein
MIIEGFKKGKKIEEMTLTLSGVNFSLSLDKEGMRKLLEEDQSKVDPKK